MAQLGARVNGIHEVTGSIPVWSTICNSLILKTEIANPLRRSNRCSCSRLVRPFVQRYPKTRCILYRSYEAEIEGARTAPRRSRTSSERRLA